MKLYPRLATAAVLLLGLAACRPGVAEYSEVEAPKQLTLDKVSTPRTSGLRQNARELVATVAGHEIGCANLALQHRTDLSQHAVAGGVAQALVDLLKAQDVDEDEREVQRIPSRALEFVAEPAIERVQ